MRGVKALLVTALFGVVLAGHANAATINSLGTCSVGDVSPAAIDCFGAVNGNDKETNNNGMNVGLNNNDFGFYAIGMFGSSDWDEIGKQQDNSAGGIFQNGIGNEAKTGTMNFNFGSLLDGEGSVMVVLKASTQFAAYLFDADAMPTQLEWATSALLNGGNQQPALSRMTLYVSSTPVERVPVPAMLPAFLLALGGFGYYARLRRAVA